MQANYLPQPLEIIADNSTPTPDSQREYSIDRSELLRLREDKLIQDKFFVYLALKMTYDNLEPSIDIPWFCDYWEMKEEQFSAAIAQLQKKKLLQPLARQLTLQLF